MTWSDEFLVKIQLDKIKVLVSMLHQFEGLKDVKEDFRYFGIYFLIFFGTEKNKGCLEIIKCDMEILVE